MSSYATFDGTTIAKTPAVTGASCKRIVKAPGTREWGFVLKPYKQEHSAWHPSCQAVGSIFYGVLTEMSDYIVTKSDVIDIRSSNEKGGEVRDIIVIEFRPELCIYPITIRPDYTVSRFDVQYSIIYDLENPTVRSALKLAGRAACAISVLFHMVTDAMAWMHSGRTPDEFMNDHALEMADICLEGYAWLPEEYQNHEVAKVFCENLFDWMQAAILTGKRAGYVYLVQAITPHNHYKIGLSKNPMKRIKKMGVKLPFPLDVVHLIPTDDRFKAERQLHERYGSCRAEGEWFALNDKQVAEICSIESIMFGGAA